MNQFKRDDEPRTTVNSFDNTSRAWLETRSLEERKLHLKPNWDNAVQLAYLSLKAANVISARDAEGLNEAWALAEELAEVGESHKQAAVNSRPGPGWRPNSYIPEPFRTIDDLAHNHAFALGRYVHYGKVMPMDGVPETLVNPEITGSRLMSGFMDAVGELIGPDVFIEGMNPYADDQPISDAS
jgi:hypothetical protein